MGVQADYDLLVRHVIAAPFFSVCFVLFRGLYGCERFSILLVVALRETLCLAFVIAASSLGGRFCVCVVLSFCAIAALHGPARAFVCMGGVALSHHGVGSRFCDKQSRCEKRKK